MSKEQRYINLWEGILREIDEQLLQNPEDTMAMSKKIYALANLERYSEALQLCDSLLKKERNAANLITKAEVYKKMGEINSSIEVCNEALILDSSSISAQNFLKEISIAPKEEKKTLPIGLIFAIIIILYLAYKHFCS